MTEVDTFRKKGLRLTEDIDEIFQKNFYPGPPEKNRHHMFAVHQFDKAHAVMLYEQGLITKDVATKILQSLLEMEKNGVEKVRLDLGGSTHTGELYITKKFGEDIGGRLHIGRSSGDLDAVSRTMTLREKIITIMEENVNLRKALLDLAEKHVDTILPTYSFHQPAQVTTFAHYLISWVFAAERDFQRLSELYKRVNVSPAGAAIGTGSDFPLNRERVAELLGYDSVSKNTRDAIFNFDTMLEAASVFAIIGNNLARLAEDLELMTTAEFNMISIADRYCTTSSIMPQKKNPKSLECIRGIGGLSIGHLTAAFSITKTASDTIEPHELVPWELWTAIDDLLVGIKIMRGIISTLKVNKESMSENVKKTWVLASDLAGTIVKEKGLPFRTAHRIVAIMVRKAIEEGIKPQEITSEILDRAALECIGQPLKISQKTLKNTMDPWEAVKRRKMTGAPAPEEVIKQIEDSKNELKKNEELITTLKNRIRESERKLTEAINNIVRPLEVARD